MQTTRLQIVPLAATLALALSGAAHAACPPRVLNGETQTTTATLGNNNTCTVDQGGAIDVFNAGAAVGIDATNGNTISNSGLISAATGNAGAATGITIGDFNRVVSSGAITATGGNSSSVRGIDANSNNTITTSGPVTATAGDGFSQVRGINAVNNNTINASGPITATGGIGVDAYGIFALDGNTVSSSGSISASGGGASDIVGILVRNGNVVTHSGSVAVTGGAGVFGIFSSSGNTLNNSGAVSAAGGIETIGIYAFDTGTVTNSGIVTASGNGSAAIGIFGGADSSITNSGTIVAHGSAASVYSVRFLSGTNTLTLLQQSRIVGLIGLGVDTDTVNLGRGENWLMTFNEDPTLSGNALNTFGVPTALINGGLTVATFDVAATVFGAQAAALYDLTETINAGLHQRLTAGNPTTYLWAQGFGAKRNADAGGGVFTPAAGDVEFTGGMTGFSTPLNSLARGGLFAGYTDGSIESQPAGSIGDNSRRHVIDQESWFAGAYGRAFWGQAFADLIVTAGETQNDSTRRILNNLAPTGVEFASGAYDGWFFNPELTLGVELPLGGGVKLVPSASVGYAGVYLDALTETGSQAAITLAARDVELIDGRLQLELRSKGEALLGTWHTALRGGIKGRSSVGDDALTGVLATTTAFTVTPLDTDDVVAAFTGADLTFAVAPGVQVFAGGESTFEDDGDFIVTGRAGAALKF